MRRRAESGRWCGLLSLLIAFLVPMGDGFRGIAGVGDMDGDGLGEVILAEKSGASIVDGRAYLVRGGAVSDVPATVNPAILDTLDGISRIVQPVVRAGLGLGTTAPRFYVGAGGDIDLDGKSELIVATPGGKHVFAGPIAVANGGSVHVVRGGADLPASIDADEIANGAGARLDGAEPQGEFGTVLHLMGDFDGDGFGEALIASFPEACTSSAAAEDYKVWMVSGRPFMTSTAPTVNAILPVQGTTKGGDVALVMGTGYGDTTEVFLGETQAEVIERLGSGLMSVRVPRADIPGEVPVVAREGAETTPAVTHYQYVARNVIDVSAAGPRSIAVRFAVPHDHSLRGSALCDDLNGDGQADLALLTLGGTGTALHLVFGTSEREDISVEDLESPGRAVISSPSFSESIDELASTGDVNDDGLTDLLLRTTPPDTRGQWRIVYGRTDFVEQTTLEELDGVSRIYSEDEEFRPRAMAITPDVSGDGIADVLLTARVRQETWMLILEGNDSLPPEIVAESIAWEGLGAQLTADIDLSDVAGSAGDFDGDGLSDTFFGGPGVAQAGALVIVFGDPVLFSGRTVNLVAGLFGGNAGVFVAGSAIGSGLDFSAAVPGDLDGDGFPEVFIRRDDFNACTLRPRSGEGILTSFESILAGGIPPEASAIRDLYASRSIGAPDFIPRPLGAPESQEGVLSVRGSAAGEGVGISVSAAGDFDGEGHPDVVLGAPGVAGSGGTASFAYIVRGGRELYNAKHIDFSGASEQVVQLRAEGVPGFGTFVSGGRDWDHDGRSDLLIGASDGRAFVVFGGGGNRNFIRGDVNLDEVVNISDAALALSYLFQGGVTLSCLDAADADDDGRVLITDAVFTLAFLFGGGPPPPAPYPLRGEDPTDDALACKD